MEQTETTPISAERFQRWVVGAIVVFYCMLDLVYGQA